jgi:hypothetical protein
MAPSQGSREIIFLLVELAVGEGEVLAVLAAASAIGFPALNSSNSPSMNMFNGFFIIKALFWDVQLHRNQSGSQAGS